MAGTSGTGRTGLLNLGNTCYLNAVMQSLAQLPTLRRALLEAPDAERHGVLPQAHHDLFA